MVRGEYESSQAIRAVTPSFAPAPLGWGTVSSDPDVHFFLQDFHEMDEGGPDMEKFGLKLGEMHQKSAEMHLQMKASLESSGKPKFGFHVTTHNGNLPQDNGWTDRWEDFFVQGLKRMLELEERAQGPPPDEMKNLLPALFGKVIPRLIRPMETHGRHIKPCLIHGDMWHGNTATDVETNEPIVFDPCCFFGHNECQATPLPPILYASLITSFIFPYTDDLRTMRGSTRSKFSSEWLKAYLKHYPATFPAEDVESRNALYYL